mmetsp:Transcript_84384/g.131790  ORF Transcript_84384/g.131790 Transcript_84384/m.131790 type:complete len:256 (-) Transcript_84384:38-805(-)
MLCTRSLWRWVGSPHCVLQIGNRSYAVMSTISQRRVFCSRTGRLTSHVPENISDEAAVVYHRVLEDRKKAMAAVSSSAGQSSSASQLTNKDGSLVGPWNAMVGASPAIGSLIERMGSACRNNNACPADLFEIGILIVGERWLSQFEWYAHERLALKAGVAPAVISAIKNKVLVEKELPKEMTSEQRAVYFYSQELHTRKRVSNELHRSALAAVGSERALIDFVATMGFYHQISMLLNAFEVPLPHGADAPFEEPE